MRSGKTILRALSRPRRQIRGSITVFKPLEKHAHVAAAHVGREIRLGADHLAERNELVGAEVIALVLLRAAFHLLVSLRGFVFRVGPEVDAGGPLVARSHTIAPIVLVGKAA